MKKIANLLLAALVVLVLPSAKLEEKPPVKRALIIAVGAYPEEGGWRELSSMNDWEIIGDALRHQGFTDIVSVTEQQATKEGILKALANFAARCQPNDIAVIHVSSHGQQITDNNKDEQDGFDEAIIPFDAPAKNVDKKYDGSKHLRDEDFGAALGAIRMALGKDGNLMVTVDACHSATATRGIEKQRGGMPAMVIGNPTGKLPENEEITQIDGMGKEFDEKKAAPMVVFSGAQAYQPNFEYKGNGSLSLAFTHALANLKPGMTYRGLFAEIVNEMVVIAPNQTPAAEGDLDKVVFSGEIVNQEPYYELRKIDGTIVEFDGGRMNGLFPGAVLELYPAGTQRRDTTKRVAVVEIGNAMHNYAMGIATSEVGNYGPQQLWAFMVKKSFGEALLPVKINDKDAADVAMLTKALEGVSYAQISNEEPELQFEIRKDSVFCEYARDASVFGAKKLDKVRISITVGKLLDNYMMGKMLRDANFNDPNLKVEMSFLPCKNKKLDLSEAGMKAFQQKRRNQVMELTTRDSFYIKVKNTGKTGFYYNIVDISPDCGFAVLFPDPKIGEAPKDYYLAAGDSFVIPKYIYLFPPYGMEMFKLFANTEPVNLFPVYKSRGLPAGEPANVSRHPMEKWLGSVFQMGTRGAGSEAADEMETADAGTTFTYSFKIVKPK